MTSARPDDATYRVIREDAAIIPGAHDVVWVRGDDAVDYLDGLLSQHIASIPEGAAARSLLLAPQGKLRATLWVLRGSARIGLVADAGLGEVTLGDLARFKLRVDAELTPEEGPVFDVWGPRAAEYLLKAGLPAPGPASWQEASGGVAVAALPFSQVALPRYVVAGASPERLGLATAGAPAIERLRVEAGEPVMGVDIDEKTIPQEAGVVEAAVDFAKGCYLGQELVARIDSRGRVNRHLRGVEIEGDRAVPNDAEVVSADKVVGRLSTIAGAPAGERSIALALLRREVAPGDDVIVRWNGESAKATVRDLPLDPTL